MRVLLHVLQIFQENPIKPFLVGSTPFLSRNITRTQLLLNINIWLFSLSTENKHCTVVHMLLKWANKNTVHNYSEETWLKRKHQHPSDFKLLLSKTNQQTLFKVMINWWSYCPGVLFIAQRHLMVNLPTVCNPIPTFCLAQTEDLMQEPTAQLGKQQVKGPYCYSWPEMALEGMLQQSHLYTEFGQLGFTGSQHGVYSFVLCLPNKAVVAILCPTRTGLAKLNGTVLQ